jgi:hypothetical protein
MQAVVRHMNAWHKLQLGVMPSTNVQTVSASGTYAVAPLEPSSQSVQVLKVPRGTSGTSFWLDFRQPYGAFDNYSATANAVGGVVVHLAPDTSQLAQSQLLDMTPETSAWNDAALLQGKTFVDQEYGISITTTGVSSAGATVQVTFGAATTPPPPLPPPPPPPPPPPVVDTMPPTAPGGLTAKVGKGKQVALSWSASTDNVRVIGYQLYRNGKLVATVTGTSYTDAPDTKTQTAAYDVVAFDAANNMSAPSNTVNVSL